MKEKLDEKLGESNVDSAEEYPQHFAECIHQAVKKALREKIFRNNTKLFYYCNDEFGQLLKKRNIFEIDYFRTSTGQIVFERMQGKITKMIIEEKIKAGKICDLQWETTWVCNEAQ